MVTQVTLGNFFSLSNGKTVLGGAGGSGLDTQALIKSLTEAKGITAVRYQDQIDLNDKQSAALGTLQSLLSTFRSATSALRNPPGVGNAAENVFKFTTASVSTAGSPYVSATSAAGAALQSYNISAISSIATAASQGTGTFTVDSADASVVPPAMGAVMFGVGTITFNGQDITIASNDSLNAIAAKFNAVSNSTGVGAAVIQIDSTHYQLSFVAKSTGTDSNFDLSAATDPSGALANVGLTVPVDGTNAAFKLNGVDIVRQSNSVSDVISGVTFDLLQTTPDLVTPYAVTIKPDTTTIQNSINNFVNAYNAIKTFEAQQTQLKSDGTAAETAVLARDQTFLAILHNINTEINSQVAGILSGNPSSLVDVGITFTNQPASSTLPEVDNILTVNDGQLTSALDSNFQGVSDLFGFNLKSNNPNLTIFKHTNALATSSFTLDINPGGNSYTATYDLGAGPVVVDLTAVPLSGSIPGYTLTGPAGSALEGLQLIYASTDAATINVTATQGVAGRLFNTADTALIKNTGTLAIELKRLQDSDTRLTANIKTVNDQVAVYQQQLIDKFSALEKSISTVNSLLQSLAANDTQRFIAAQ